MYRIHAAGSRQSETIVAAIDLVRLDASNMLIY
jgi:hypothetical protein